MLSKRQKHLHAWFGLNICFEFFELVTLVFRRINTFCLTTWTISKCNILFSVYFVLFFYTLYSTSTPFSFPSVFGMDVFFSLFSFVHFYKSINVSQCFEQQKEADIQTIMYYKHLDMWTLYMFWISLAHLQQQLLLLISETSNYFFLVSLLLVVLCYFLFNIYFSLIFLVKRASVDSHYKSLA